MLKKLKQYLIAPINFNLTIENCGVPLKSTILQSKYITDLKKRSTNFLTPPPLSNIEEDFYFLYNNENLSIKGEIALWRAVILQAGVDLNSKSKKKIAQSYRIKALMWFNLRNEGFKQVCEYAGFDPQYVIERIIAVKDKAVEWMNNNAREVL